MGKAEKAPLLFIANIPDGKINGFTDGEHTLHKDENFRLDNQGVTSGKPQFYNLQVQVNRETSLPTLKRLKGETVAKALVPKGGGWTPDKIRDKLEENKML